MDKKAILHIPLSSYAFGLNKDEFVLRLRTAHDDISRVILNYGDRCYQGNPISCISLEMQKTHFSSLFDWFEVKFKPEFRRIAYYFEIVDTYGEVIYYYGDRLEERLTEDRNELFQVPYFHPTEVHKIPSWTKDAIVYNIFPDSFATSYEYISDEKTHLVTDGKDHYGNHGGKIRGIIENLDYIEDMGFNTLYLNPIASAGEYHKYDTIDYFHVDPVFGSDDDFLELTTLLHKRGMKIILDGVFNHSGWHFFAFEDCIKNGKKSKYWSWYNKLEDPIYIPEKWWEERPNYECFSYERMMPKLNQDNLEVQSYFASVGQNWVEKFDIDGWRLDVADEVSDAMWIKFRDAVKSVKKDVIFIGEIWQNSYHWLQGNIFDSSMNYEFLRSSIDFFATESITSTSFNDRIVSLLTRYSEQVVFAQLNILDSHDTSRFLSRAGGKRERMRLAIVFLLTFVGMPSVFYADEMENEGLEEKDFRSPYPWGKEKGDQYYLYKELIKLRRDEIALRRGSFKALPIESDDVYSYLRIYEGSVIKVTLNRSTKAIHVKPGNVLSERGLEDNELSGYGYVIERI